MDVRDVHLKNSFGRYVWVWESRGNRVFPETAAKNDGFANYLNYPISSKQRRRLSRQ